MANIQKKRSKINLEVKHKIVKKLESGMSIRKVAEELNISKGTVQNAQNQKNKINDNFNENKSMKRYRFHKQSNISIVLHRWYSLARSQGYTISGPILQEKAKMIANELGIAENDFSASSGWLQKFLMRNNISLFTISGESAIVDLNKIQSWKENLNVIIEEYDLKDIFNADETGYFFKMLPNKTLSSKGMNCKGGKLYKDRITVLLTCSANGEKLPPLVIGRSKLPRCLRGIDLKSLGIEYESSSKAWMTGNIFNAYLANLNEFFKRQNRKILLFIDNCPAHVLDSSINLSHIRVKYLPPNLTSSLQPLDGGIIRSVKANARKLQIMSLLLDMDSGKHVSELAKSLTILDAMNFISKSWKLVKLETIRKCFHNSGFVKNPVSHELQELNELEDEISCLQELAKGIDIYPDSLVYEEVVQNFEIRNETTLLSDVIVDFLDKGEDEEEIVLNNVDNKLEVEGISYGEALQMTKKLITYTKKTISLMKIWIS